MQIGILIGKIDLSRQAKGQTIAQLEGQVRRIDARSYIVRSQSGNGEYEIISGELGWLCSCYDHMYRGQKCKHIFAVEFSLAIRKRVERANPVIIAPVSLGKCPHCESENVVRHGVRKNKSGNLQRYYCSACTK